MSEKTTRAHPAWRFMRIMFTPSPKLKICQSKCPPGIAHKQHNTTNFETFTTIRDQENGKEKCSFDHYGRLGTRESGGGRCDPPGKNPFCGFFIRQISQQHAGYLRRSRRASRRTNGKLRSRPSQYRRRPHCLPGTAKDQCGGKGRFVCPKPRDAGGDTFREK